MARNPKKVVEALAARGSQHGAIRLREFTPATIVIMQKIGSPLMDAAGGRKEMTDMDILKMVFILAHPAGDSFSLISDGPRAFEQAVIEYGDGIPLGDLPDLGKKLIQLFVRATSTAPAGAVPGAKKKGAEETKTPSPTSPRAGAGSAGS